MKPRREGKQSFLSWAGSGGRLMATGTLLCLFLGCGEKAGPVTAPPAPQTGVISVAVILDAPANFYGREVRLEGKITGKLPDVPMWEFVDGTGSIAVDFGQLLGVPAQNQELRVVGVASRGFSFIHIDITDWKYLTQT